MYAKHDYIQFYESTREEQWCEGTFTDEQKRHCAVGHLFAREDAPSPERLQDLFRHVATHEQIENGMDYAVLISDGRHPRYQQSTPRARILAALNDLPQ